jgi:hypothetical protein
LALPLRAPNGRAPIQSIRARADDRKLLEPDVQRKEALRSPAPAPASNHLLDRGPGRKLTRGWVKIVVDIGLRALRTAIEKSMFVCFAIYSELERATLLFLVPTYSWMAKIFIRMFQNGSNKHIDVICVVAVFRCRKILP